MNIRSVHSFASYLVSVGATGSVLLSAELNELKQPLIGISFDVVSTVDYRIESESVTDQFSITATGTATMSDAFVGVARLRIANEKSINENIKALLKKLAAY